VITRKKHL